MSYIVLVFVQLNIIPEAVFAIGLLLNPLVAISIGYFSSAFERFLEHCYALFLVLKMFSIVNFFKINEIGVRLIKFFDESAFLVEPAGVIILVSELHFGPRL